MWTSLIFLAYFAYVRVNCDEPAFLMAHVLVNNGIRTKPFAEHYKALYWNRGRGYLVREGKYQALNLGTWLKTNYAMPDTYSEDDIYVQASDMDRCIDTASIMMAGMYEPTPETMFQEGLNWQPIPVHTVQPKFDYVLSEKVSECKYYQDSLNRWFESAHMVGLITKNQQEIQDILNSEQKLEHSSDYKSTVFAIIQIVDVAYHQKNQYGVTQSIHWWYDQPKHQEFIHNIYNSFYSVFAATPQMAKIKMGFLLKEMLDRFSQKVDNKLKPDRKLWVYSTHELVINPFLRGLYFNIDTYINASASIILELFLRDSVPVVKLKLLDLTNTDKSETNLVIPGCTKKYCPLETVYQLFQDIIPMNFETMKTLCEAENNS